MRTLVDIPDSQIEALAAICKVKKVARAQVIRAALAAYIDAHGPSPEEAFGAWGKRRVDGLAYQKKLRSEW